MPHGKTEKLGVAKYPPSKETGNRAPVAVPTAKTGPTNSETTGPIEATNHGRLPVSQAKPAQKMNFLIAVRAGQGAAGRNPPRALAPSHFRGAALCGNEGGAQCQRQSSAARSSVPKGGNCTTRR
jgi:hypothetical protein